MSEERIFEQMKMWRRWTVELLRTIPKEVADQIPHGHNNNILWNAGHILVGWDHTIFPAVNMERQMPLSYHLMFPRGSKSDDWIEKPPSMGELIKQLDEQTNRIEHVCMGHLEDPLKDAFLGMKTLGDMVLFHMNHENLHMGIIKSMRQILLR